MDETDWSQWFTIDEDGKPVFSEAFTGSNRALAIEKYYEYTAKNNTPPPEPQ